MILSKPKPVVLVFLGYFLPGFRGGGPIRTIANMVERLGSEFDFWIITRDRDLGDKQAYESIIADAWNTIGQVHVFYASPSSLSMLKIAQLIRKTRHDVIYLNSFFDARFTLSVLLIRILGLVPATPAVLAPRGEFSTGALNIKKWKKLPFIRFVRWLGIFEKVFWHASTAFESSDIERVMKIDKSRINLARNISIAPDLVQKNSDFNELGLQRQENKLSVLDICFLSRIAPMKNLDFALKVLAKVKVPVNFFIYGPKELPAYWAECDALIQMLPSHVHVVYCGSVENMQVRSIISKYDLFFVPSRGENFGHVFIESLSAGVPILVSDQTPWRGLKEKKLGWDIPLDQFDNFVYAIEEAAALDSTARDNMRENCIQFARAKAEDNEGLEMNRNIFLNAINSSRSFSNT